MILVMQGRSGQTQPRIPEKSFAIAELLISLCILTT